MKIGGFFKKVYYLSLKIIALLIGLSVLWVLVYRWLDPPFTQLMLKRKITSFFADKKTKPLNYEWRDYNDISPHLGLAVIAAEDQNFPYHFGFDIEAIQKALKHNKGHRRKRGASTITQQVAKNVFLWESRNWLRKGMEVYFTFLIEVLWDKQRIIEVYLNVAEMGDLAFGAEAISKIHFNKPAKKLTVSQSALLAAILPNPRRYRILNPTGYIIKRQSWIISQMEQLGGIQYLKNIE